MAVRAKVGTSSVKRPEPKPKSTRQGSSHNTTLGATSRNGKRKGYRGQGRG